MIEWCAVRKAASCLLSKHAVVAGWKHRALSHVGQERIPPLPKDCGSEQGDVDGLSNVAWLWEWLLLRIDCTPLTKAARTLPWIGTTHWEHSGSKLNTIARCSRSKTFSWVVQKGTSELMTRDMPNRKTEGSADLWYMDDFDTICHQILKEVIYFASGLDATLPEWRSTTVAHQPVFPVQIMETSHSELHWGHASTSSVSCVNVSSCVRTRRQNLLFFARVLASVETTTSSECTVSQFFKRDEFPQFLDSRRTAWSKPHSVPASRVLGSRGREMPALHSLQPNREF